MRTNTDTIPMFLCRDHEAAVQPFVKVVDRQECGDGYCDVCGESGSAPEIPVVRLETVVLDLAVWEL